jgi:hypothetical protein
MSDGMLRCCREEVHGIQSPAEGDLASCVECGAFLRYRDGKWRWIDQSSDYIKKIMREGAKIREAEIPHLRKDADAKNQ